MLGIATVARAAAWVLVVIAPDSTSLVVCTHHQTRNRSQKPRQGNVPGNTEGNAETAGLHCPMCNLAAQTDLRHSLRVAN
jgi:hypothetical protein